MPLDPQVRTVLDALNALGLPDISESTVADAREYSRERAAALPPGPDVSTRDAVVPAEGKGVTVRVYRPHGTTGALPVLVWFHGGGFVLGDLTQADADCRTLCDMARCAVLSVDYPLAPEHPFPAAPECAFAVTRWIAEHPEVFEVDPTRLAVGGDSAGGNLAAAACLLARDRGGPAICHQLLVYPVADLSRFDTASYRENATGYFLTRTGMMWFRDQYVPSPERARDPLASPLLTEDARGLPPAHILTAEFDPLRDEAEAWAARLSRAHVEVVCTRYDGAIHGFFTMGAYLSLGAQARRDAAVRLRAAFDAA